MAIKKLQNGFTTPEQSKRLLELGVPADSADCYYRNFANSRVRLIPNIRETDDQFCIDTNLLIPCWSVGRLIEIFSKCYTGAKCYYSPRNLYKMEFWIERFNRLSKIGFIDFSKMEN